MYVLLGVLPSFDSCSSVWWLQTLQFLAVSVEAFCCSLIPIIYGVSSFFALAYYHRITTASVLLLCFKLCFIVETTSTGRRSLRPQHSQSRSNNNDHSRRRELLSASVSDSDTCRTPQISPRDFKQMQLS